MTTIHISSTFLPYSPDSLQAADFESKFEDFVTPLEQRSVDFAIREKREWKDVLLRVATFALKIILFPWGLYELARYTTSRLIMTFLYPAQSRIARKVLQVFFQIDISSEALCSMRKKATDTLRAKNHTVRDVVLEIKGARYSGLLIRHPENEDEKWALQATGNAEPIEYSAVSIARIYREMQCNVLLINGPSIGLHTAQATTQTMGDAQEIGLCFLETALKAKQIVLAGRSLGAAAMGQAILQHTFKEDIKYLAVSQVTFDRVSHICGKVAGEHLSLAETFVKKLVVWSGCEIDRVAASERLAVLKIKEVLVQERHDSVIPPTVRLNQALKEAGITKKKVFIDLCTAQHISNQAISAPKKIIRGLRRKGSKLESLSLLFHNAAKE